MEPENVLKPHHFIWMDNKVVIILEEGKVLTPIVTPDGKIRISSVENTNK